MNTPSNPSVALNEPAIPCPICGEGSAILFEEVRNKGDLIGVKLRYRECDTCEMAFAGAEESRFNKAQVMQARGARTA